MSVSGQWGGAAWDSYAWDGAPGPGNTAFRSSGARIGVDPAQSRGAVPLATPMLSTGSRRGPDPAQSTGSA